MLFTNESKEISINLHHNNVTSHEAYLQYYLLKHYIDSIENSNLNSDLLRDFKLWFDTFLSSTTLNFYSEYQIITLSDPSIQTKMSFLKPTEDHQHQIKPFSLDIK